MKRIKRNRKYSSQRQNRKLQLQFMCLVAASAPQGHRPQFDIFTRFEHKSVLLKWNLSHSMSPHRESINDAGKPDTLHGLPPKCDYVSKTAFAMIRPRDNSMPNASYRIFIFALQLTPPHTAFIRRPFDYVRIIVDIFIIRFLEM